MTSNPTTDHHHRAGHDAVPHGIGEAREFPRTCSVLDLFEVVARGTPDRPAVSHGPAGLTFAELDAAATTVAAALREHGVGPGDLVPLLIGNSLHFPVAVLGAMKAGAVYVPVDPDWPATRIQGALRQLAPAVILAVRATGAAVPASDGPKTVVLAVDDLPPAPAAAPADGARPGPEDLIYGYFTSGSTGTPKCTLNRHRGLVNRLTAMSGHFGDGAGQIVLQNSRPTFDSSMWQVLWPLTTGGRVVIPDRRGILDLEETCRIIGRHGITITDFVPSVLSALVALLELRPDLVADLSGLRRMLIGGEAANRHVLQRLHTLLPGLRVTNTYGPTECSIGSVFHDIDLDADPVAVSGQDGSIPLGGPIPNTAALVLDDDLRPLPPGKIGEIFIGGECVGAGYLHDAERTAQAFVDNPFTAVPGPTLYRTGDLGHVGPDGLLRFDGRRDDQVKVGGVRIELAEIERALLEVAGVRDAAVVASGEGAGRSLVAFLTAGSPGEPETDAVVAHLRRQLPAEVVPRRLVRLAELPLTPNGKLDRRRLEQLAAERIAEAAEPTAVVAPASGTEELVAGVWREVLQVETVSVDVAFTEYGGTSLLAHRIGTLLGSRAGRPVDVGALLRADTVREQAALLLGGGRPARADGGITQLEADRRVAELGAVRARPAPQRSHRVLVTGSTGFIGAHLLAELLSRPTVHIICLVRAADVPAARERLRAALRHYRLAEALTRLDYALGYGQLRIIAGDLAAPELGLPHGAFTRLAHEVDAVLHAGARVNFLSDYAGLRADNVLGTRELLRLALTGDGCRLHVLSSFSAFGADELAGHGGAPIGEDRLPDPARPPADGYSRSKHVVEHVLEDSRRYGLDSVVYRLGEIWPHSRTGVPNAASIAHGLIAACARTGIVFPTTAATDHLPVDLVAGYVATAVTGRRPTGDRVHLLRPTSLRFAEVFDALVDRGIAEPGGFPRFWARLHELVERDGADELLVRAAMLLPAPHDDGPAAPAALEAMFTDSSRHFAVAEFTSHAPSMAALVTRTALDDLTPFLDGLAPSDVGAGLGARR
ncbi:amino acid adenylation domain-containing protein [Dactylosporangium sp. NPDC051484]|uniref:non-ribosomal peptide synthetase n=1 Tax=Dactylosporangium sp. NPDC051484 TaxID=3154942 RepID=UPI00344F1FBA